MADQKETKEKRGQLSLDMLDKRLKWLAVHTGGSASGRNVADADSLVATAYQADILTP
jgi:hypothetical protein